MCSSRHVIVIGRKYSNSNIFHCNVINSMPDVFRCHDYHDYANAAVQMFKHILLIVDYTHF